jgi:hypothetical protein
LIGSSPIFYYISPGFINIPYLLPFVGWFTARFLDKAVFEKLCREVSDFLHFMLKFCSKRIKLGNFDPNFFVFSGRVVHRPNFNVNDHLSERITSLYEEINRLLLDTRVRVREVEDYLRINRLVLIQDVNYNLSIQSFLPNNNVVTQMNYLNWLDDIIIDANTRRDDLIEEVRRLEAQINTIHQLDSSSVFSSRTDMLSYNFDELIAIYRNLFFNYDI